MNYTIKSGDISFTVYTLGAELISAKNQNGDEFIWQANPDFWGEHAPLLFPCAEDSKTSIIRTREKDTIWGYTDFCAVLSLTWLPQLIR